MSPSRLLSVSTYELQARPAPSTSVASPCKAPSLRALESGSPRWPSLMIKLAAPTQPVLSVRVWGGKSGGRIGPQDRTPHYLGKGEPGEPQREGRTMGANWRREPGSSSPGRAPGPRPPAALPAPPPAPAALLPRPRRRARPAATPASPAAASPLFRSSIFLHFPFSFRKRFRGLTSTFILIRHFPPEKNTPQETPNLEGNAANPRKPFYFKRILFFFNFTPHVIQTAQNNSPVFVFFI